MLGTLQYIKIEENNEKMNVLPDSKPDMTLLTFLRFSLFKISDGNKEVLPYQLQVNVIPDDSIMVL